MISNDRFFVIQDKSRFLRFARSALGSASCQFLFLSSNPQKRINKKSDFFSYQQDFINLLRLSFRVLKQNHDRFILRTFYRIFIRYSFPGSKLMMTRKLTPLILLKMGEQSVAKSAKRSFASNCLEKI